MIVFSHYGTNLVPAPFISMGTRQTPGYMGRTVMRAASDTPKIIMEKVATKPVGAGSAGLMDDSSGAQRGALTGEVTRGESGITSGAGEPSAFNPIEWVKENPGKAAGVGAAGVMLLGGIVYLLKR